MSGWTIYRFHKWIAVAVGGFLLIWLISGIVMILPRPASESAAVHRSLIIDFQKATVSPAQAVASLEKAMGKSFQVKDVNLRWIHDTVAYEIDLKNGGSHLIDAVSGRLFEITPALAEQIVRDTYRIQAAGNKIERVDRHDFTYPWGPLPVYRIVFDDDHATHYYVSTSTGKVQRSDRLTRSRAAIESLHTFEPVKLITKRGAVRKGLLILLSVVGVGAALTGYYLALLRRL